MSLHRDNSQLIGSSIAILDLMDQVSRLAPLNRPILIVGERGTGKELIAERIHYLSLRWNAPFFKMNCAALPETLLDSELFGAEAGSYTGANKRRAGRFELADRGSLFLDEIGTLSMAAQEKLLRVIEYGEYERVGGQETLKADTRVIGATNVDLPRAAEEGHFRHDLLDRLAFDVLTVPPLRARRDDIPELVMHFGMGMAREQEWVSFAGFSDEAMEALCDYPWPGNVRELKNVVERAIARAWDGEEPIDDVTFDPFDSPWRLQENPKLVGAAPAEPGPAAGDRPFCFKTKVAERERDLIKRALKANRYNQKAAAAWCQLSYDQFRHAMKKHDLQDA